MAPRPFAVPAAGSEADLHEGSDIAEADSRREPSAATLAAAYVSHHGAEERVGKVMISDQHGGLAGARPRDMIGHPDPGHGPGDARYSKTCMLRLSVGGRPF
jgi:hypothetical protein